MRWIHARQENRFKIVFQVCRMHCDCRSLKFFLRRMETIILGWNIQKLHHACNPFASLLRVRTAQRLVQNVTSFLELNNRLLADFAMLSDDAIFTISVLSKPSFAGNRALAWSRQSCWAFQTVEQGAKELMNGGAECWNEMKASVQLSVILASFWICGAPWYRQLLPDGTLQGLSILTPPRRSLWYWDRFYHSLLWGEEEESYMFCRMGWMEKDGANCRKIC